MSSEHNSLMQLTQNVQSNGGGHCGSHPNVVFLVLTVLVTTTATALLCTSIISDRWEYIKWDRGKIESIARKYRNQSLIDNLDWILDQQVARVRIQTMQRSREGKFHKITPIVFLVPSYSSLWYICPLITAPNTSHFHLADFPKHPCINYLTPNENNKQGNRPDSQHRMQNLSISCALVCLIILACSALIGAFGIMQHQISAVLVTGVMYLLAATFAMFTLTIIHFKRTEVTPDCLKNLTLSAARIDGIYTTQNQSMGFLLGNTTDFLDARIFHTGWGLHTGWCGVCTCVIASILWILLSKIMRHNPINVISVL